MQKPSELFSPPSTARPPTLGRLESEVLRVLWGSGESSVRDVLTQLGRPLAYTTVMTTLDRLFKKGLLDRHLADRSFRYVPLVPRKQAAQPADASTRLCHPQAARDLLVSHLVDTVCEYDETLLDELERDIAERRRYLTLQAQHTLETNRKARA
jgi:predicted transcriptional regulator